MRFNAATLLALLLVAQPLMGHVIDSKVSKELAQSNSTVPAATSTTTALRRLFKRGQTRKKAEKATKYRAKAKKLEEKIKEGGNKRKLQRWELEAQQYRVKAKLLDIKVEKKKKTAVKNAEEPEKESEDQPESENGDGSMDEREPGGGMEDGPMGRSGPLGAGEAGAAEGYGPESESGMSSIYGSRSAWMNKQGI